MQLPQVNRPGYYPAEEMEAHEQELKEDFTGLPPQEYLADWEQTERPVRRAFSFRKWLKKIGLGKLDQTR